MANMFAVDGLCLARKVTYSSILTIYGRPLREEQAMTIKRILVPMPGSLSDSAALDGARLVAGRCLAHISVLHARPPATEFLSQTLLVTRSTRRSVQLLAEREGDEQARRARAVFEEYCALHDLLPSPPEGPRQGPGITWLEKTGSPTSVLSLWGRLADLIVVPRPARYRDNSHDHKLVEAGLFHSGKPVLICPPVVRDQIGAHIAIAWNGSTESARAVSMAMPFLMQADTVNILQVADGSQELDAADLQDYLSSWGINAGTHAFRHTESIGKELYSNARAIGADMLLMGAYGHSRSREMVLGGASREVIEHTEIPALLFK